MTQSVAGPPPDSKDDKAGRVPSAAWLAFAVLLCACSDGATRIAYDIESNVAAFRRSDAKTTSIRHVPEVRPDGCAGAYTVQFTASSALMIWCKKPDGSGVQSSHTTTYHLRFVEVPRTYKLDKDAGEATTIDLAKENGRVVVTAVR